MAETVNQFPPFFISFSRLIHKKTKLCITFVHLLTSKRKASYQRLCVTMWITCLVVTNLCPAYAQLMHIYVHIGGKLHACNLNNCSA